VDEGLIVAAESLRGGGQGLKKQRGIKDCTMAFRDSSKGNLVRFSMVDLQVRA
jgi:hypothetical protein